MHIYDKQHSWTMGAVNLTKDEDSVGNIFSPGVGCAERVGTLRRLGVGKFGRKRAWDKKWSDRRWELVPMPRVRSRT